MTRELVELVQDRLACTCCGDDLGPATVPQDPVQAFVAGTLLGDRITRHPCIALMLRVGRSTS